MAERIDRRSRQAEAWRPWYGTARWQRRRAEQLRYQPLCERCLAQGLTVRATVANHRIAHKGDPVLFWEGELESVCKSHHDRDIQREERGRPAQSLDSDGWPAGRD